MLHAEAILSFSVEIPRSSADRIALHTKLASASEELQAVPREVFLSKPRENENQTLLELVDPQQQSLPYLFALSAHISLCREDGSLPGSSSSRREDLSCPAGAIWLKILDFLNVFDPLQVRHAGQLWRGLLEIVFNELYNDIEIDTPQLVYATETMRTAMLRLDPSGSVFTSTHPLFAALCLKRRLYTTALPILDRDIFNIPISPKKQRKEPVPSTEEAPGNVDHDHDHDHDHDDPASFISIESGLTGELTHRPILSYQLYGAMIYMALGQWKRARHFLVIAVLAPGQGVSKIQTEAMKKLVIVELLTSGRATYLFSSSFSHNRHLGVTMKWLVKPYYNLARTFESSEYDALENEIVSGKSIWDADKNTSLIAKVPDALRKHCIQAMKKSFIALPISEIGRRISADPKETLIMLENMIVHGELNAFVASTPELVDKRIVRFVSVESMLPGEPDFLRLQERNASAVALEREIQSNIQNICKTLERLTEESAKFSTTLEMAPERIYALLLRKQRDAKNQDPVALALPPASATTAGSPFETLGGHFRGATSNTSSTADSPSVYDHPMDGT